MPVGLYDSDPAPLVENKIAVSEIKRLFHELPPAALSAEESKALGRLKRFIDGEFKSGLGFAQLAGPQENSDKSSGV